MEDVSLAIQMFMTTKTKILNCFCNNRKTTIVVWCYNQRKEYLMIVWKRHLHFHKEGMQWQCNVTTMYQYNIIAKYRNLYLPGRVSRIIVSALFLSSSLMITIDRWSRMVGMRTLRLQARPLEHKLLAVKFYQRFWHRVILAQVLYRFVTTSCQAFLLLIGDH